MSEKLIRFPEVERRTGFCRSWIYKLIAKGEFPVFVKTGGRAVAFVESEVDAWVTAQIHARTGQRPSGKP